MTPLMSVFVLAASIVATPSGSSSPALSPSTPPPVEWASIGGGGVTPTATCTVYCGEFNGSVSCTGTTCNAVNRSYPGEVGHVTCDQTTTYYCPAFCTNGQSKIVTVGPTCGCPDGRSTPKDRYICTNGDWEYDSSFCGGPFCQG